MERLICLAAGYVCGCLLTAEVVARWKTGRGARTLGSGNPGMANIAGALGKGAGALVLAGDLLKTALACALCRLLLAPDLAAWPSYTPDWARPWAIISPSGAASTAAKG